MATGADAAGKAAVVDLVTGIAVLDELAAQHRDTALAWLAGTDDIYRREKPRTPSPHLVSYFLLVDRAARRVLLCDHRLSGLWLPTGGHVEPGEHPADTVRREALEELGVPAVVDERPFLLTVTGTVGAPEVRHVDVSLWFALDADVAQRLDPDAREFREVRWWAVDELAGIRRAEPHLGRAVAALGMVDRGS